MLTKTAWERVYAMTTGRENHAILVLPLPDSVAVCANTGATVQQLLIAFSALITPPWIYSVHVFVICSGPVKTARLTSTSTVSVIANV